MMGVFCGQNQGFADTLRTVYPQTLPGGNRVFCRFADDFSRARTKGSDAMVTADEIRAACREVGSDVEARIVEHLTTHGKASTLDLVLSVSSARGSRRDLIEGLAQLVEDGRIVGERKPHGRQDWLAGVTWRLA